MIWRNAWALWGLIAVAVPVLIHLLGRERARVQKFPTLRFLELSRVVPTRRRRIKDLVLLVVRAAALAVAAIALAQPLLLTGARRSAADASVARAIIVDTSLSMKRESPVGGTAVEVARRTAQPLATEAQRATTIETNSPAGAMAGAVAWLATQPGRGEIVVISDFQRGSLDSADVVAVPASIGVKLVRIDVAADSGQIESLATHGEVETVARILPRSDGTEVQWSARPTTTFPPQPRDWLTLITDAGDEPRAEAARHAALTLGAPSVVDTGRRAAIVYSRGGKLSELVARVSARPLADARATDVVARLRRDRMLGDAVAAGASSTDETRLPEGFVVVSRERNGRPVVVAGQDDAGGRPRLVLLAVFDPGSLASAALISAVHREMSSRVALSEWEPAMLSPETLRRWARSPGPVSAMRDNVGSDESDGRWLWALVLILLAAETLIRRRSRSTEAATTPRVAERGHERVA